MNSSSLIIEKITKYGVNPQAESKSSLQEKIIRMYELLQQKTTQNLLLRKQNDDIKIQINTINQLFQNVEGPSKRNSYKEASSQRSQHFKENINNDKKADLHSKYQHIYNTNNNQNPPKPGNDQRISENQQCSQSEKPNEEPQFENISFENRTLKCSNNMKPSNFYKKQRLKESVRKEQDTSKKGKEIEKLGDTTINEKIELLMKQNQTILKRMNQIQVNFIKGSHQGQIERPKKKYIDDRSTNFSGNVTSIHNIWAKKEYRNENSQSISSHKKHYSTNNLRSYCPSVQRQ